MLFSVDALPTVSGTEDMKHCLPPIPPSPCKYKNQLFQMCKFYVTNPKLLTWKDVSHGHNQEERLSQEV